MLAVGTITVIALDGDDRLRHVHRVLRLAEADHVAGTRVGLGLTVGHPHAAANHDVVTDDSIALHDRDKAEIMGENIDIVMRRQCDGDLEFARQVGTAENRFILDLATGNLFLIQPDLVPSSGARQQMARDVACQVADRGVEVATPGICGRDDVAIDVAAGGDGVHQIGVQALHQRLQVALQDAMELHGFTRGQADGVVGTLDRKFFHLQPLFRGQNAGRHPHPNHEAEGLLHPLLAAFSAQVAVVLLIKSVEFG